MRMYSILMTAFLAIGVGLTYKPIHGSSPKGVDQQAWLDSCEEDLSSCEGDLVFFPAGSLFPENERIWKVTSPGDLPFLQSFGGDQEIEKIVVSDGSPAYKRALKQYAVKAYDPSEDMR